METHFLNKLWCSEYWSHVTTVYADGVFPVFPQCTATWLVAAKTIDVCLLMRRPKYSSVSSRICSSKEYNLFPFIPVLMFYVVAFTKLWVMMTVCFIFLHLIQKSRKSFHTRQEPTCGTVWSKIRPFCLFTPAMFVSLCIYWVIF